MSVVIKVENLSKQYRLGVLSRKTLTHDLQSWWARKRGKDDPNAKLHQLTVAQQNGEERIWALKDVSFEVKEGEVLGIIGKNGAGKSTLLKILSRVTAPTSGNVKVKGRVASLLEVGTGFHPELTGRENIYINGAILGMKRAEIAQKFDEIVDFAGVDKFIDTPVKRYSSGMHVRLAFAVAAHLDPEILVVDEVLAVGDAEFQKKCLGKMGQVARGGRTVLFVSHNMSSISNLSKYACWFEQGKVHQIGRSLEIVQNYLSGKSTSSFQSLLSHPGRISWNNSLLSHVSLLKDGEETSHFFTNESFELVVECNADPVDFPRLSLGFVLTDRVGARVFATNIMQYGAAEFNTTGCMRFNASIGQLNLSPGLYNISLHLQDGTRDVDVVEDAISFDVLWNSSLKLRFPPMSNWGPMFSPVHWKSQSV